MNEMKDEHVPTCLYTQFILPSTLKCIGWGGKVYIRELGQTTASDMLSQDCQGRLSSKKRSRVEGFRKGTQGCYISSFVRRKGPHHLRYFISYENCMINK